MSSKDWIGYQALLDNAQRSIIREALRHVARGGTMGNHHFLITFETHAPGVVLSDAMRERFPEQITIVLQHQFWNLKVEEDAFEVGLSFNKVPEMLRVPFDSIRQFADPSQNFGLNIGRPDARPRPASAKPPAPRPAPETPPAPEAPKASEASPGEDTPPPSDPTVVSLDRFRKK